MAAPASRCVCEREHSEAQMLQWCSGASSRASLQELKFQFSSFAIGLPQPECMQFRSPAKSAAPLNFNCFLHVSGRLSNLCSPFLLCDMSSARTTIASERRKHNFCTRILHAAFVRQVPRSCLAISCGWTGKKTIGSGKGDLK